MNYMNTLLQDITIFTGNDATQLEDWLLDIETAVDLSAECRTKLAQAKSRDLTCTLMTEALTSGKSWEHIKDALHLKVCNSDIHTSVSHFMEIQQKEKESLAAYIHHYNRGPQTLADSISKVENLQTAQQLTATLLSQPTVNVMPHEGNHCFQCQESGHIA